MNAIVPIVRTGTLAQYDAARTALAEACRIDEVLSVRNESERMHLYARQAKDRALMADAVEIRLRAERQLGILLKAAREAGQIATGRPRKSQPADEAQAASEPHQLSRVTLEEAGIDKKLSSIAQKRGELSEQSFEMFLKTARERVISDKAKIISAPGANEANRVQNAGDLDYSPTCPWATRALIERVLPHISPYWPFDKYKAWEPACGEGHMAEVLREYFKSVKATDIHGGYGYADHIGDFLDPGNVMEPSVDWIITNPPFEDRVIKFIVRALALAKVGVAMFLHLRYLEGVGRYEQIYSITPPTIVAPFVERVPLLMGQYDPDASTTTAFMWLVWIKGMAPQAPFWIPPGQRDALTRPDDAARFTQHPVQRRVA